MVNLITAADLFYRKKCYTKYFCKCERAKNDNGNVNNNIETKFKNRKKQLFHLALKELETQSFADITSKISHINTLKSGGDELLRRAIQTVHFGVDDTFCDAGNLKKIFEKHNHST